MLKEELSILGNTNDERTRTNSKGLRGSSSSRSQSTTAAVAVRVSKSREKLRLFSSPTSTRLNKGYTSSVTSDEKVKTQPLKNTSYQDYVVKSRKQLKQSSSQKSTRSSNNNGVVASAVIPPFKAS